MEWLVLTNASFQLRVEYSNYPFNFKIEINWVEVRGVNWFESEWFVSYSPSFVYKLQEWDEIKFWSIKWNAGDRYFYRQNFVYEIPNYSNWFIKDWLDNNKVRLSDVRFQPTKKCDWIITQSWNAWEKKAMVFRGYLTQTAFSVWDILYLNNSNESDRWNFWTTKIESSDNIVIWKTKRTDALFVNLVLERFEENIKNFVNMENNTIYKAETDWIVVVAEKWTSSTWTPNYIYADFIDWATTIVWVCNMTNDTNGYVQMTSPVLKWQFYKYVAGSDWHIQFARFYPINNRPYETLL